MPLIRGPFCLFEAEQARIAHELHRETAQNLALLALQIEVSIPQQEVRSQLQETCQAAIASVRQLMNDLRQPTFRRGWEADFRQLLSEHIGPDHVLRFVVRGTADVPHGTALIAYRFLQHLLRHLSETKQEKRLKSGAVCADKWFRLEVVAEWNADPEFASSLEDWAALLNSLGAKLRIRRSQTSVVAVSLRLPLC